MIIWINGGFGAGKTTLAEELRSRLPAAVFFDPENVGAILRQWVPVPTGDFQDLPSWRELVIATALSLRRHHAETLIVAMTLINDAYRDEILGALAAADEEVVPVFLDLDAGVLRQRITDRVMTPDNPEWDRQAREFCFRNMDRAREAAGRQPEGTLLLRSDRLTPAKLADEVLARAGRIGSSTMEQRILGRTGKPVSIIGLGTWQLGADWGSVTEADALAVLHAAAESGVTFFDTADVYGDGRSEKIIGRFLASASAASAGPAGHGVVVATKMGRRMAQEPENYTLANFRAWTDRSRAGLGTDRLDLVQLHCPPTPVFESDAVFDALDTLVAEERIAAYGVSVETCAQALAAIARPGLATVQIIFNAFRRKPLDQVLPAAAAAGVGIIVRVPLASGLLSGRYTMDTEFSADDHRSYNRHGEAFDVGETFSGVDYAAGVRAAAEFAAIAAEPGASGTTAQAALRWVTQQPGVTTVIPGARNPAQARQNAAAAALPPLTAAALARIEELYDKYFRADIHSRW